MYGEELKNYLNRYNILKHLPVFELLEFQIFRDDEYKSDRNNEERVNEIFIKFAKHYEIVEIITWVLLK